MRARDICGESIIEIVVIFLSPPFSAVYFQVLYSLSLSPSHEHFFISTFFHPRNFLLTASTSHSILSFSYINLFLLFEENKNCHVRGKSNAKWLHYIFNKWSEKKKNAVNITNSRSDVEDIRLWFFLTNAYQMYKSRARNIF